MKSSYSEAFIEQALVKVFSRGARTVLSVAQDLNVKYHTLKYWMKHKKLGHPGEALVKERRPQDWSTQEQLVALHETHRLSVDELNAWCRGRGLFAHHLASWKAAFCVGGQSMGAPGTREIRTLKDEVEKLKREVLRKDRALAEAAALLILQKKFRALWEDEVK